MSLHTDDVVIANASLPIEGGNLTPVTVQGTVTTAAPSSSSAVSTQVVLSQNTNATLLSANASRKGALIFIPLATSYVKYGATASPTSFGHQLTVANSTIEVPFGYTGRIDILSTQAQTITVTEFS